VNKGLLKSLSFGVAAVAIVAIGYGASAQEKAPAKKLPACNALKDETACKAQSGCNWVAESKDSKGKLKHKAYCRSNPKK
jgi:hypothetical protein